MHFLNRLVAYVPALTIIAFLLLGTALLVDRGRVLMTYEWHPAQYVGCELEWVSRAPRRATYKPVAMSVSGYRAEASIGFWKSWCEGLLGLQTGIYAHPDDPNDNRLANVSHFWLLPLVFLIVLTSYAIWRAGTRFSAAPFTLVAGTLLVGWLIVDANLLGWRQASAHLVDDDGNTLTQSQIALGTCIREAMRKQGTDREDRIARVTCSNAGIEDLSRLDGLENLEELYLSGNQLTSLATLRPLPRLRKLTLGANPHLNSLAGLERSPALEELYVSRTALESLAGLERSSELRLVQATDNRLVDISALQGHAGLEEVRLSGNPNLADISAFADKPRLHWLTLYKTAVGDISPILASTALRTFGVSGTGKISCDHIAQMRRSLPGEAKLWWPEECEVG